MRRLQTGGVHTALDVVKATMAGAHVTQMVSALLLHGPAHLQTVVDDLRAWMRDHEWSSLSEMRGNMSLRKVADPEAYERVCGSVTWNPSRLVEPPIRSLITKAAREGHPQQRWRRRSPAANRTSR